MSSEQNHLDSVTSVILPQLKEIASSVMYAAEGGTLEQVLERIAQVSSELVNARYAALGIPDGKGGLRYFKVAGITPEAHARLEHLPRGYGLIGAIMRERKAIRLARIQDDPRSVGFCGNHPSMTSFLGVPVQIGQQLFGMLYLCDRRDGQPFSEQDEWLIDTMAGYAALAIAGSDLSSQQSRLALLEERERIAMELHDGVIQSLYAIGMQLDLMRASDQLARDELGETINNLNAVIDDIRHFIMDLHRRNRPGQTVYECLQEIIARLHAPQTLTIHLDAPQTPPPFSGTVFEGICQIANEAISNAIRHAEAQTLTVSIKQSADEFHLQIEDDGKGFNIHDLAGNSGLGLRNLQQRAMLYHGRVQIDSTPGKGTRLSITIPTRRF
jgi:signal transduction histidine kinase